MQDPFDLARFVAAQEPVLDDVKRELAQGKKRTHWMWFVFPQLRGLGRSAMAEKYGIVSPQEARAYLRHDILGSRLRALTQLVNEIRDRMIGQIFGSPDDIKFHSSMTLFAAADPSVLEFRMALVKYYDGKPDRSTIKRLTDDE